MSRKRVLVVIGASLVTWFLSFGYGIMSLMFLFIFLCGVAPLYMRSTDEEESDK